MASQKKHQAVGRDILAQYQAKIREGGEQGCAAFLDAVELGVTAYGLFASPCLATRRCGRKRLA